MIHIPDWHILFSFLTSIVFAPCVCLHRQNWSKLVVLVFCWSICQNVNYHEKGIFLPSFNIHIIVFGCSGFESGISWHSKRKLSFVQKQEIISINGSIKPNLFRHYVVCLCMYICRSMHKFEFGILRNKYYLCFVNMRI